MPSMQSLSSYVSFRLIARRGPVVRARTGAECRAKAELFDLPLTAAEMEWLDLRGEER